ncbi:MAG: hypothetical protein HY303_06090 [Candidatus Wallbacteria bacterium]|nr:hypothetical protein [Candidatus Wallbacteria bacterium]
MKRQVIDLARRLAGGDGAVFRTLKHARHTLKLLEQQSRERDKRARRSTLTVELV